MQKSALSLALSAALFTGAPVPVSVFSQEVEPVVAEMGGNYLQGEVMVVNTETRLMTLKDVEGVYHVLHVPPQVSRIDQIKIGDKVTITEVSSALIGLTPTGTGTPIAMDTSVEVDRDAGSKPGGTMTETLTVTGEIVGVDKAAGTVTVKGPNTTRTFDVDDLALLEGVKVGDGVIAEFRNVIVGEVKSGYTRKPGPPTP
jgi:Cu/Ag efflux protein CusF